MRQAIRIEVALGLALAVAQAQAEDGAALAVRVYDYAGVPEFTLRNAEAAARRVLKNAGIGSEWADCPRELADRPRYPECRGPAGERTILVKILPDAAAAFQISETALGLAISASDGQLSSHAFVFYRRVPDAAQKNGKVPLESFLGYVIVHEISHLLLGSGKHAGRGVMRSRWRPEDLREMEIGQLGFPREQAGELQAGARGRSR